MSNSTHSPSAPTARPKLRKYLIFAPIQIKYALIFALVVAVAMGCLIMIQQYFFSWAMTLQRDDLNAVAALNSRMVYLGLAITAGAALLTFLATILITHRFLGPIFAIRRALEAFSAGRPPYEIKIRKNDEMKELAELLNKFLNDVNENTRRTEAPPMDGVAVKTSTEQGFSLLEVLIAVGLMGIVASTSATLMVDQNRQIKQISGKIATNDTKNSMLATLQDPAICASNLDSAINPALVFDSTAPNPSISFTQLRSGTNVTAPAIVTVGQEVSPNSGVVVSSITLANLTDVGGGKWTGIWTVALTVTTGSTPLRPIMLNSQQFDVDLTVPTAAKLTGCHAVSGASGGLSQWISNAGDIFFGDTGGKVGIGTTTPQVPLDVRSTDLYVAQFFTPTLAAPSGAIIRVGHDNLSAADLRYKYTTTPGEQNAFFIGFSGSRAGLNYLQDRSLGLAGTPRYPLDVNNASGDGIVNVIKVGNNRARQNGTGANIIFTASAAGADTNDTSREVAGVAGLITDISFPTYTGALSFSTANGAAPAERMRIDSDGNVGIGTTSPTTRLEVSGDIGLSPGANRTLGIPSVVGVNAPQLIVRSASVSSGTGNGGQLNLYGGNSSSSGNGGSVSIVGGFGGTTAGYAGGVSIVGGQSSVATNPGGLIYIQGGISTAGPGGAVSLTGGQALGGNNNGGGVSIVGGAPSGTGTIGHITLATSGGNVGVGVTGPTSKLQVAGDVTPDTTATKNLGSALLRWNNIYLFGAPDVSSDSRLKKDVKTSDLGLEFINSLRPVSWIWKDANRGTTEHYGVIAQETEAAITNAKGQGSKNVIVSHNEETDSYSVRYTELISPLIKAVQELYHELLLVKAVNDTQDRQIASKADQEALNAAHAKIQKLEADNAAMEARLDKLEKMLKSK